MLPVLFASGPVSVRPCSGGFVLSLTSGSEKIETMMTRQTCVALMTQLGSALDTAQAGVVPIRK